MAVNFIRLAQLINLVPDNLNKKLKKEPIPLKVRKQIIERDKGICSVCERQFEYGSNNPYLMSCGQRNDFNQCNIHHIIPNGDNKPENLETLCIRCHQTVHYLLYVCGKWNFARPI